MCRLAHHALRADAVSGVGNALRTYLWQDDSSLLVPVTSLFIHR